MGLAAVYEHIWNFGNKSQVVSFHRTKDEAVEHEDEHTKLMFLCDDGVMSELLRQVDMIRNCVENVYIKKVEYLPVGHVDDSTLYADDIDVVITIKKPNIDS